MHGEVGEVGLAGQSMTSSADLSCLLKHATQSGSDTSVVDRGANAWGGFEAARGVLQPWGLPFPPAMSSLLPPSSSILSQPSLTCPESISHRSRDKSSFSSL